MILAAVELSTSDSAIPSPLIYVALSFISLIRTYFYVGKACNYSSGTREIKSDVKFQISESTWTESSRILSLGIISEAPVHHEQFSEKSEQWEIFSTCFIFCDPSHHEKNPHFFLSPPYSQRRRPLIILLSIATLMPRAPNETRLCSPMPPGALATETKTPAPNLSVAWLMFFSKCFRRKFFQEKIPSN